MTPELIRQQQETGFLRLRFVPELEAPYRQLRATTIRQRARLVSVAGLCLFLLYVAMDLMTLPGELARATVIIRLGVVCPTIVVIAVLSLLSSPSDAHFERLYTGAYLIAGLSVVGIIAIARHMDFPLPYEGMLLMLMFGYFAMGLPFYPASLVSGLLVLAYLAVELWAGLDTRRVLVNLAFLMTANIIGMVGAWITDYRHRAHYLDRLLLDTMRQQAQRESEQKTHLITAASHDLRQPLNVIAMTLDNLHHHPDAQPSAGTVAQLRDTVRQLRQLLTTVLDSARLNAGMIEPEISPISPAAVLQDVRDRMEELLATRHIRLDLADHAGDTRVLADPQLLLRVLQNLVVNAADHSRCQRIRVAVERAGQRLRFFVEDDGRGLTPELRDRVFTPYTRGEASAGCPGLGLGLAIVQELTHLMAGSCAVDSAPGQGTTFQIDLPALVTTSPAPVHE